MCRAGRAQCSLCGEALDERHVGEEQCYCPRCRTFVTRLGEGEEPAKKEEARIRAHPPRGMSVCRCADGGFVIRDGVPWRWLWMLPLAGAALGVFFWMAVAPCVSVAVATAISTTAFMGFLLALVMLYKLAAKRIRFKDGELVISTLWLGFILNRRRRVKVGEKTTLDVDIHMNWRGRVAALALVCCNGEDRRVVWCGGDQSRFTFISSMLEEAIGRKSADIPYRCPTCDADIPDENIDMRGECTLFCPSCKIAWPAAYASIYRTYVCDPPEKPGGVEELPNGFIYRERGAWRGAVKRAALKTLFFWMTLSAVSNGINRFFDGCGSFFMAVFAVAAVVTPFYILWRGLRGCNVEHRIVVEGGRATYTCRVGRRVKEESFPCNRNCSFGVSRQDHEAVRAAVPVAIVAFKDSFAERHGAGIWIFENLRPGFYDWAVVWLYLAAARTP